MNETRYTDDHEWARLDGDLVVVGITDYAQEQLGDIVYFELPQIGDNVTHLGKMGEVESIIGCKQDRLRPNGRGKFPPREIAPRASPAHDRGRCGGQNGNRA